MSAKNMAENEDTGKSPTSMSVEELESAMAGERSESPTDNDVNTEESSTSEKDDFNKDKREKFIPRDRFDEVISDRDKARVEKEDLVKKLSDMQGMIEELQSSKSTSKSDVSEVKEIIADKRDEYIKTLVDNGIEPETAKIIATANFKVFERMLNDTLKDVRDKEIKPLSENLLRQQTTELQKLIDGRVQEFAKNKADFKEIVPEMQKIYNSYSAEKKSLLDTDEDGIEFLYNKAKKMSSTDKPDVLSNQIKGRSTSRLPEDMGKSLKKMSIDDLEAEMRKIDIENLKEI